MLLALVSLPVVLWIGGTGVFALSMVRRSPRIEEPPPSLDASVEQARIVTKDGVELGAWMVDGQGDRASVLIVHGHRANRSAQLEMIRFLVGAQCDVLAITMRAHGDSGGRRVTFGYTEREDVIAAVEFLQTKKPEQPIVVVGRSMGAAAALFASEALGTRVGGYALESPYSELEVATKNRLSLRIPAPLDAVAYVGLELWAKVLLPVDIAAIAPVRAASNIPDTVPVLILSGDKDDKATPAEADFILRQVASHGWTVHFPRAPHDALWQSQDLLYKQSLLLLIERARAARARPAPKPPAPPP